MMLDSKGDAEEVTEGSTVPQVMEKAVTRSASFRGDTIIDQTTGRAFTSGEVQRVTSLEGDEAQKALNNILSKKRESAGQIFKL